MNKDNYAVIMAGGIGSRFWPMSREEFPKQFLDILGTGKTLIQQTFHRLKKICPKENILVLTNIKYRDLCLEQLPELHIDNIICEPTMRNTAACIAYASFKIYDLNTKANIIVAPSDHLILQEENFLCLVNNCLEVVSKHDILLTLGITPSRPETGYGYIQYTSETLQTFDKIFKVKTFTEKPNQELAVNFLNSGDFLWNSGMFIWSVKSIILAFRKHLRDIYEIFEDGKNFFNTNQEKEFIDRVYPGCKNISIDYGIMEKSHNVYVVPSEFGWSDLGTWGALSNHIKLDENGNAIQGNNTVLYHSSDNIVKFPNDKLVVLYGLNGFIVVENEGELLICKRDDEQEIKNIVSQLKR
ncbi:MAG: mannose-1-phosphate guanylyltransferase [Flavobacteriales bacterium]|nr:mannose-1-phosphate guanylyltransferase [Flavobacteriales bacterium]|tara:strand:- start:117972 stop:119039 length:1068 start_codon:yes stop_codon:yes gene_type:complete